MPLEGSWYHATQDVISRSQGRSAVGLAAYVTGERMKNIETGVWSKRNHPGDVTNFGTTVPEGAMAWLTENENLAKAWNAVQNAETRINSQLARHWNFALWSGASVSDHVDVMETIAQGVSDKYGVMVTWAVHQPTEHGDPNNWHGHIAMNMRRVGPDGFGPKAREMVDKKTFTREMKWVRELIADTINDKLDELEAGFHVSHESYADRGIDKEPTRHRGNKQNQQELKGHESEVGRENREIEERNRQREQELDEVVRELDDLNQEIARKHERELDERFGRADDPPLPGEEAGHDESANRKTDKTRKPELNDEDRIIEDESKPFDDQIRANGEIHHEGIGWQWMAFIVVAIHVIEAAVDFVREKWQEYIVDRRGHDDREPDDPDIGR